MVALSNALNPQNSYILKITTWIIHELRLRRLCIHRNNSMNIGIFYE